jgi:hypothetical protein
MRTTAQLTAALMLLMSVAAADSLTDQQLNTLERAYENSPVVVIGTITDAKSPNGDIKRDRRYYDTVDITVSNVLKNTPGTLDIAEGEVLSVTMPSLQEEVKWNPRLVYSKGQTGTWFLESRKAGFVARYPGQFWPLETKAEFTRARAELAAHWKARRAYIYYSLRGAYEAGPVVVIGTVTSTTSATGSFDNIVLQYDAVGISASNILKNTLPDQNIAEGDSLTVFMPSAKHLAKGNRLTDYWSSAMDPPGWIVSDNVCWLGYYREALRYSIGQTGAWLIESRNGKLFASAPAQYCPAKTKEEFEQIAPERHQRLSEMNEEWIKRRMEFMAQERKKKSSNKALERTSQ